jgi:transcriptional regulator with XRE-family HTH domain
MPKKSNQTYQKEDKRKVAELIRRGLEQTGITAQKAAENARISQSHLSRVLTAQKSLTKQKLLDIASVLNIEAPELLKAAGYESTHEEELRLFFQEPAPIDFVEVVTDPRFVNTAMLLWIFNHQPLRGIKCKLIPVNWNQIPNEVAKRDYAFGIFSRRNRGLKRSPGYKFWADLHLSKTYYLMARPGILSNSLNNLRDAEQFLNRLLVKCKSDFKLGKRNTPKPIVIVFNLNTLVRLQFENNPLMPWLSTENFSFIEISNPDAALNEFLEGRGDLIDLSLNQVIVAKNHGCHEVLSSNTYPLMVSIQSLICSPHLYEKNPEILSTASAIWFKTIRRMRDDDNFRADAAKEIPNLLREMNIYGHNIDEEMCLRFLPKRNGETMLVYADNSTQLIDEWQTVVENAFSLLSAGKEKAKIDFITKNLNYAFSSIPQQEIDFKIG